MRLTSSLAITLVLISFTACSELTAYRPWENAPPSRKAEETPKKLVAAIEESPKVIEQGSRSIDELREDIESGLDIQTIAFEFSDSDIPPVPSASGPTFEDLDAAPSTIAPRDPFKVALLLPLSGKAAKLGQDMLQASEMALFDLGARNVTLISKDTQSTPEGAQQAAYEALQDGASLILGPLFFEAAEIVKPIARSANIPMVSFSTNWKLAGSDSYVMGFMPYTQVRRVVSFAAQQGYEKYGVLAPDNEYGRLVAQSYQAMSRPLRIKTHDISFFPLGSTNISPMVRDFTGYDNRVANLVSMKEPLEAILENKNASQSRIREAQAELEALEIQDTYGDLPFDAVLLPVGGHQAVALANLLSYYDLGPDQVRRLGTGLWDDPALAYEAQLENAWFAAPDPNLRAPFENRYQSLYGEQPQRLATLSYDATALAIVLARNAVTYGLPEAYTREAMTNPNGFAGLDGIFRFSPNGLVERGLAILEFTDGEIKVVDPAPNTFENIENYNRYQRHNYSSGAQARFN